MAAIVAATAGCGGAPSGPDLLMRLDDDGPRGTLTQLPVLGDPVADATDRRVPVRHLAAVVERRTQLRRSPGGPVLMTIGRRTPFRGRQVLAVVARQGPWLGVLHQDSGDGRRVAWIPADAARTERRRYEVVVDRSALRATLLRDDRPVLRFRIGVGRAGNATPLGRYAVTDRLVTSGASPYGCCIVALTARQHALPQGWSGGDRIAMHGGPAWRVGIRTTSGCMTVGAADLRRLFGRVQLGTRVTIRA